MAASFTATSCLSDGENTIVLESGNNTGIPDDSKADPNPMITVPTTNIPNVQYSVEPVGDDAIVRIDMTGIQEVGTLDWLRLVGTAEEGQNVWLSIDGKPKGIKVYNNSDDEDEEDRKIQADLVFVVDNSGSMSEEADVIARDIKSWASKLEASNLDIRFGCVGYDGRVNGGINITDAQSLSDFLDRSSGTSRTYGFVGSDASSLSSAASVYSTYGECGGAGIRFADANMKFRFGSNRIYVNFTDEPNQPGRKSDFSTEFFKSQTDWNASQGTVHTVYSADTTYFRETMFVDEKPWRISQYTGGTILQTDPSFSGVTLESLPVTGAMQNSYIIRFTNVKEFLDGQPHVMKITILSADGKTKAERVFYVTFVVNEA